MRRELLVCLLLAGLTLGVYWPAGKHGFIDYDDPEFTANPHISAGLSWQGVFWALSHQVVGNWHPVTTLSHMLDCQLFRLNAGAHHLVNVAFHIANAVLLFLVFRSLTGAAWRSALVAALFALHPLRVESVAWIAERKDVLSAFFFLLTIWAYARYAKASQDRPRPSFSSLSSKHQEPGSRTKDEKEDEEETNGFGSSSGVAHRFASVIDSPWSSYGLALLFFGLGLMSKPMVVTLPFVLLLLDWWPLHRLQPGGGHLNLKPILLEKVPFLLLSAIGSALTFYLQQSTGAMKAVQHLTLGDRFTNAIVSYVRYLGKMFWPTKLAVIYPHPAKGYFLAERWPWWEIMAAGLLLLAVSILCLRLRSSRPYLAFGWFWFLGTTLPVIGLVQVGEQAMADRYTYIPLMGPTLSVVWGVFDWVASRTRAVSGSGIAHARRSGSLINTGLQAGGKRQEQDPAVSRAFRKEGQTGETVETVCEDGGLFCTGLKPGVNKKEPGSDESCFSRGEIFGLSGLAALLLGVLALLTHRQLQYWKNTVALFRHTIEVTADNPSAQFCLGVGLEKEGQIRRALVQYRVALAIDPGYWEVHCDMAQIFRKAGDWAPAAEHYLAALRYSSNNLSLHLNLASVLPHLGRAREALSHYETALQLDSASVEGLNNLAWLLATSSDPQIRNGPRAVDLAEQACALTHYDIPIMIGTLAAAYAEAGRFAEAVTAAQRAATVATQIGQPAVAARNQELLELYRAHKPCREGAEQAATGPK